jgi:hypothetical protein
MTTGRPKKPETLKEQIALASSGVTHHQAKLQKLEDRMAAIVHSHKLLVGGVAHEILHFDPDHIESDTLEIVGIFVQLRSMRAASDQAELDRMKTLGAKFYVDEHGTREPPHTRGGFRKSKPMIAAASAWMLGDPGVSDIRVIADRNLAEPVLPTTAPAEPEEDLNEHCGLSLVVVRFGNKPPEQIGGWLKSDLVDGKTRFGYNVNNSCWMGYGDAGLLSEHVRAAGGVVCLKAPEGTETFLRTLRSRIPV